MDSPDTGKAQEVEIVLKGIAAAPGISLGPAYLYSKAVPRVQQKVIRADEVASEIERLRNANQRSEKELQKIHAFAEQKLGSQNARIFEAQIMILGDSILMGTIEKRIASEMKNAEFIVADEISKYKQLMLAAHDEYMHERALDVDDVMNRIIRNIQDQKLFSRLEGESIIVSETLHAITGHRSKGAPFTVEAGIVRVADALDMARGRSRVPFESGRLNIHSLSAYAIEEVRISPGLDRAVRVEIAMSNSAGIYQVDELLATKLRGSGLERHMEVIARIDAEHERRLIPVFRI